MATRTNVKPVPCPACEGSGEVPRAVRVGRKRHVVGEQSGICLTCLGTGEAPASEE
ncbi:hypothetical protein AB0C77_20210 [Streptomyces sp. NPDC048629]|uniref:hypothetical protein n=1 Tax=Streptomyces sp. NPDC048629 TaxID=3154824 RepID=UPI00343CC13F